MPLSDSGPGVGGCDRTFHNEVPGRPEPGQRGVYANRALAKVVSDWVLWLLQRRGLQTGSVYRKWAR